MRPAVTARASLAALFAGMGAAHFAPEPARAMAAMIPSARRGAGRPSPADLVRITGVCEIAGAAGLLWAPTRRLAGGCLVVFLAAVFPANAVAATQPDRFGRFAVPFWPRLAGQAALGALVAWAAWSD